MITDMLKIPAHVDVTPCGQAPLVFSDPALDPDVNVWTTLDDADKHDVAMNKRAAEDRALAYCARCPILDDCRSWSMRTRVFGPAGGMRDGERNGKDVIDKYLDSGSFPDIERLIEVWLGKNQSMAWIAAHLDVSPNLVARVRNQLAESAEQTQAREAVSASGRRWSRVSVATTAMYDLLAANNGIPKQAVLEYTARNVPLADAIAAAPKGRSYESSKAQAAAGSLKYARNLLRIAVRDGNVLQADDDDATLTLNPEITPAWIQWREASERLSA